MIDEIHFAFAGMDCEEDLLSYWKIRKLIVFDF